MATQIKLRRDTYQNWYDSNPVLGLAEPGFDTTNKKLKIGDGVTDWRSLAYFDDKETVLSALTQDIVPDVDNTYNIGSPDKRWQHGYFANGSLYVGDIKLSNNNGTLLVQQVTDAGLVSEAPVPNAPGVVTTDRIINGSYNFVINTDGSVTLPNYVTQRDTNNVTCLPGVDTVIYTAPSPWQYTIKLLIQAEGNETQGQQWDTQSSEMIVAKSWRNDTVVASVYGVVHTSVDPLATYSARWNATSSRVEVLCRPTSATFNLQVRTFATEMITSD